SEEEFYLFNIYAPCENNAKQLLWDSLTGRLQQLGGIRCMGISMQFDVKRKDAL
ncbi:endonuclease/exonuclease/phosphatase family protein, partial [Trifolium medium]|nr:endonuclease/exonuclease/phosphatase family protein [Trifolium medium]